MNQIEKLLLDLRNERALKEKFLRERNDFIESYKECQADAVELYKQVQEMKKTLEWYADKKNWNLGVSISMGSAHPLHEEIKSDKGNRARQALKGDSQ